MPARNGAVPGYTVTATPEQRQRLAHETHRQKDEHARQLKAALGAVTVLNDEARTKLDTDLSEARAAATRDFSVCAVIIRMGAIGHGH